MKNKTKYKIPKKYHNAIKEVYQDDDGLWCELNEGFVYSIDENKICNGENYKQLIESLNNIILLPH